MLGHQGLAASLQVGVSNAVTGLCAGLNKLEATWSKMKFQFHKHKDTEVYTVKMAEEDFEVRVLFWLPPSCSGNARPVAADVVHSLC